MRWPRAGTRKGVGGLVLSTYTFRGLFYLSAAWDDVPYQSVVIEGFFESVRDVVREMFLLDEGEGGKEGLEGEDAGLLKLAR